MHYIHPDPGVDQIQPAEAAMPTQCLCQTDALSQHQALTQGELNNSLNIRPWYMYLRIPQLCPSLPPA